MSPLFGNSTEPHRHWKADSMTFAQSVLVVPHGNDPTSNMPDFDYWKAGIIDVQSQKRGDEEEIVKFDEANIHLLFV